MHAPSNSLLTVPRRLFCCGSLLPVFGCFLCQSFGDVSPYVCSYYFSSVWLLSNTFWEIAALSVDHMFSLYLDYM